MSRPPDVYILAGLPGKAVAGNSPVGYSADADVCIYVHARQRESLIDFFFFMGRGKNRAGGRWNAEVFFLSM